MAASRTAAGKGRWAAVASERGMTVVEVMVAAVILVIGSIAVLGAVQTAARGTYRAEQSQVEVNRLQQEMERIRQLPFNEVALSGVPAHDADPDHPNWRVSSTSFALNANGTNLKPLVYNGSSLHGGGSVSGGTVSPGPTPFQSGDVSGDIYRYVTWLNDDSCPDALCPGTQDKKRVIVVAVLDETASGGVRAYQEIHADLTDPEATFDSNALPPDGDGEDSSWQFFLTDTPCSSSQPQEITASHATHNTFGLCSNGLQTGTTPGAPDLMFTEAPSLNPDFPPDQQPLFDYATDVEPASGTTDKGLQVRIPSAEYSGGECLPFDAGNTAEENVQEKVHKWLSPEIPAGFDVELSGDGTLSLWTQSVSNGVHQGEICAWLFVREVNGQGVTVDTPVYNLDDGLDHFPYEESVWPNGDWQEIDIPLNFAASGGGSVHLLPGSRLGVALAVNRSGTVSGDGLQFEYDTPSFDSRLEVKTSSALPNFSGE